MANVNRANGFLPVGTLDGSPWNARVRRYPAANRSADTTNNHGDIYIGDPVTLSSGNIVAANSGDAVLGVAIGVGNEATMFDPSNLNRRYAPLTITTGLFVYVAPADQCIFEAQTNADLDLVPGSLCDFTTAAGAAHGSRTTSISSAQIKSASNNDLVVVENKLAVDNDVTITNARHIVRFRRVPFAQATT